MQGTWKPHGGWPCVCLSTSALILPFISLSFTCACTHTHFLCFPTSRGIEFREGKIAGPIWKADPMLLRGGRKRGWLQVEVNQYVIFSMVSRMILYGVTVYNAILIISYRIITYKLIYIIVPEEHPEASSMHWPQAQGSSVGLGLKEAKEWPHWGWRGPNLGLGSCHVDVHRESQ